MPTVIAIALGIFAGLLIRLVLLLGLQNIWPEMSSGDITITALTGLFAGLVLGIPEARSAYRRWPWLRTQRTPFAGGILTALVVLAVHPSLWGGLVTLAIGTAARWFGFSWASWFFSNPKWS